MSKKTGFALLVMIMLYVTGLAIGSLYQVNIRQQAEMAEYLKNGVETFGGGFFSKTKEVFCENLPELFLLFVSAYLPFGVWIVSSVMTIRGFLAGFAITAAIRTYGISGMMLCVGNLLSVMVCIPCFLGYGLFIINNAEKSGRIRLGIFSLLYLLLVITVDSFLKGGISTMTVRFLR